MFTLSFLYPRPRNRQFDYDYHRNVHLPFGIGMTVETLGVSPKMVWIERIDEESTTSEQRYAAIAHVLFESEPERNHFATLFDHAEAARRLSVDWDAYTEAPPEVRLSRWTLDDDMSVLVDRYKTELFDLHR